MTERKAKTDRQGPSYVFAVEVGKATDIRASDIHSTPELAAQFSPANPTPTPNDK